MSGSCVCVRVSFSASTTAPAAVWSSEGWDQTADYLKPAAVAVSSKGLWNVCRQIPQAVYVFVYCSSALLKRDTSSTLYRSHWEIEMRKALINTFIMTLPSCHRAVKDQYQETASHSHKIMTLNEGKIHTSSCFTTSCIPTSINIADKSY